MKKFYKGLMVALFACAVPAVFVGCGETPEPETPPAPPAFEAVSYANFEEFLGETGVKTTLDGYKVERTIVEGGVELGKITLTTNVLNGTRTAKSEINVNKDAKEAKGSDWVATVYYKNDGNAYVDRGNDNKYTVNLSKLTEDNQTEYYLAQTNMMDYMEKYKVADIRTSVSAALTNTAISKQVNGNVVTFKMVTSVSKNLDDNGKQTTDTTYTLVFTDKKISSYQIATSVVTVDKNQNSTTETNTVTVSAYTENVVVPTEVDNWSLLPSTQGN